MKKSKEFFQKNKEKMKKSKEFFQKSKEKMKKSKEKNARLIFFDKRKTKR